MKRDEVFPSKYLKFTDLNGGRIEATIERAMLETLKSPDGKEQNKMVLYFRNAKKTLPLNRVNFEAVTAIVGDDETDHWPGHRIELYADKTQMAGKTVDCVRIRAPAQRELPQQKAPAPKPSPDDETDDGVPF